MNSTRRSSRARSSSWSGRTRSSTRARRLLSTTCRSKTSPRPGVMTNSRSTSNSSAPCHRSRWNSTKRASLRASASSASKSRTLRRHASRKPTNSRWITVMNCKYPNSKKRANVHANSKWKWVKTVTMKVKTRITCMLNSSMSQ